MNSKAAREMRQRLKEMGYDLSTPQGKALYKQIKKEYERLKR